MLLNYRSQDNISFTILITSAFGRFLVTSSVAAYEHPAIPIITNLTISLILT